MNEYYWNLLNAREKKEIAKLEETTTNSKEELAYICILHCDLNTEVLAKLAKIANETGYSVEEVAQQAHAMHIKNRMIKERSKKDVRYKRK